jgi:hypothetical protein
MVMKKNVVKNMLYAELYLQLKYLFKCFLQQKRGGKISKRLQHEWRKIVYEFNDKGHSLHHGCRASTLDLLQHRFQCRVLTNLGHLLLKLLSMGRIGQI